MGFGVRITWSVAWRREWAGWDDHQAALIRQHGEGCSKVEPPAPEDDAALCFLNSGRCFAQPRQNRTHSKIPQNPFQQRLCLVARKTCTVVETTLRPRRMGWGKVTQNDEVERTTNMELLVRLKPVPKANESACHHLQLCVPSRSLGGLQKFLTSKHKYRSTYPASREPSDVPSLNNTP